MWNYLSQGEKGEIKQILELKMILIIYPHAIYHSTVEDKGSVNYLLLNDEKKLEAKEIYKPKKIGKN